MEPPSIEPLSALLIAVNSFNTAIVIAILVMIALLISSALISGSEVAFFSLSPTDREELQKIKNKKTERVLELLNEPKYLLANILIANNFINIAIVVISSYLVGNLFSFSPEEAVLKILITVVGVTFLILLVGEVIPKVYAANNSLALAQFMSLPLTVIGKIASPLSSLLVKSTSFIDSRIKKKGNDISVNDLEDALEITEIEGVTEDDKKF